MDYKTAIVKTTQRLTQIIMIEKDRKHAKIHCLIISAEKTIKNESNAYVAEQTKYLETTYGRYHGFLLKFKIFCMAKCYLFYNLPVQIYVQIVAHIKIYLFIIKL